MALSRFVLTATVTVPAGTPVAISNGFGVESWAGPTGPPQQWAAGMPVTFIEGTAMIADTSGGTSAACPLYAAIGAGNLRPYVQDQDDVSHAAILN